MVRPRANTRLESTESFELISCSADKTIKFTKITHLKRNLSQNWTSFLLVLLICINSSLRLAEKYKNTTKVALFSIKNPMYRVIIFALRILFFNHQTPDLDSWGSQIIRDFFFLFPFNS